MFPKYRRKAQKSIRARIAISARCVVTIGADCVLAQETAKGRNLLRNKNLLLSHFPVDTIPNNTPKNLNPS
jgi:hypothetical protein